MGNGERLGLGYRATVVVCLGALTAALGFCRGGGCASRGSPPVSSNELPPLVAVQPGDAESARAGPVAVLRSVQGDVRWRSASAADWVSAREGQELRQSDAVQTMENGRAELHFLESAGVASLGPNTTLRVPDQAPEAQRLKHVAGVVQARLGEGEGAARLEVELPPGLLVLERNHGGEDSGVDAGGSGEEGDQGQEAFVEVDEGRTAVTVVRGQGRVVLQQGGEVAVSQDHYVEIDGTGALVGEGEALPVVRPLSPGQGENIRTRGEVTFVWEPTPPAKSYLVEVQPEKGRPTVIDVGTGRPRTSIDLASGSYLWSVRAVKADKRGQVGSYNAFSVDVDQMPPELNVSSPSGGDRTTESTVQVSGRTETGAQVKVNGRAVTVSSDGRFSTKITVSRGLSNVVVEATDSVGNVRAVSRAVLRE